MENIKGYDNWKLASPGNETCKHSPRLCNHCGECDMAAQFQLCVKCGEYYCFLDDTGHCENCRPARCIECEDAYHADELHSGYCNDCLKAAAEDEMIAVEYISPHYGDGTQDKPLNYDLALFIAESAMPYIYNHDIDKGCEVHSYEFLIRELQETVKYILWCSLPPSDSSVPFPKLLTIDHASLLRGVKHGLREACLDDKSHFSSWLANPKRVEG